MVLLADFHNSNGFIETCQIVEESKDYLYNTTHRKNLIPDKHY